MKKLTVLAFVGLVMAASGAMALDQTIFLSPSTAGLPGDDIASQDYFGVARIQKDATKEAFSVRIFCPRQIDNNRPMYYLVSVKTSKGWVNMGTMRIVLGSGILSIFEPSVPVNEILAVRAGSKKGKTLYGAFKQSNGTP